ncbi:MAG: RecX family transcriptional regulator [Sphingomonas sp.]
MPVPPLDAAGLERLALAYVGRYATTRAKLSAYLQRKLGERGWGGEGRPPVEPLVARCATLGYVDDRQFATMRAASLGRRGYGARRVGEALRAAGITVEDAVEARAGADDSAWETAVAFVRRRRIGPFAAAPLDPDRRRKALAAMLRAGHGFEVSRRLIDAQPGDDPDLIVKKD